MYWLINWDTKISTSLEFYSRIDSYKEKLVTNQTVTLPYRHGEKGYKHDGLEISRQIEHKKEVRISFRSFVYNRSVWRNKPGP